MESGAITGYIDVAQLVLYAFWIFFAGLIYYLRQEDKREGYPLESERSGRIRVQGFPPMPRPKTFKLMHGGTVMAPRNEAPQPQVKARPVGPWLGAPLTPTGDPMQDGVGPAAYAQRANTPDLTLEGHARIVPLRVATDFSIEAHGPDPRRMTVVGADRVAAGKVVDVWVDRTEPHVRYLEVETSIGGAARRILLPIYFTKIDGRARRVNVVSVLGHQIAAAPGLASPDVVTLREEDRITAYFASGNLYATPERLGPLI